MRDLSEQPCGEHVRLQIRGRFLQRAAVGARRAERGFCNVVVGKLCLFDFNFKERSNRFKMLRLYHIMKAQ